MTEVWGRRETSTHVFWSEFESLASLRHTRLGSLSWTQRVVEVKVWGQTWTLLEEQGSHDLYIWLCRTKGSSKRPTCIRNERARTSILFCSVLFYSILFYSILFYSILFYYILFYSVLFYSILFYSLLFYSILFCSILSCFVLFYTILFYSVLFYSILFCSILFYSVLFCSILFFHCYYFLLLISSISGLKMSLEIKRRKSQKEQKHGKEIYEKQRWDAKKTNLTPGLWKKLQDSRYVYVRRDNVKYLYAVWTATPSCSPWESKSPRSETRTVVLINCSQGKWSGSVLSVFLFQLWQLHSWMASSSPVSSLKFHYRIHKISLSIPTQSVLWYFASLRLIILYIWSTSMYSAETGTPRTIRAHLCTVLKLGHLGQLGHISVQCWNWDISDNWDTAL